MTIKAKGQERVAKNRKGRKISSSEKAEKMVEGIWKNLSRWWDF